MASARLVEKGKVDISDWEWGDDRFDVWKTLDRVVEKRVRDALGSFLGDPEISSWGAPFIEFAYANRPRHEENPGLLDLDFCVWATDDPPFV